MDSKSLNMKTNCPTVSEWFYSEYCNYKGREITKLSEQTINSVYVNRIEPFIGDKKLNEITFLDCKNIILKLTICYICDAKLHKMSRK